MSPEIKPSAAQVRSRYAFLFGSVAELHRFRYGEKPSTAFEEVKKATERLKEDGYLSEFLISNLEQAYSLYSELLPGKRKSEKWYSDIEKLLDLVIGDVCAEIKELSDAAEEFDRESLIRRLLG